MRKPLTAARFESSLKSHQRNQIDVSSTRDESNVLGLPTSAGTSRFKDTVVYQSSSKVRGPASIGSFPMGISNYYSYQQSMLRPPENLNNLYGSYTGSYGKHYAASFNGTFRNRSSMNTMLISGTTREEHN
jgi:hypothetical protein